MADETKQKALKSSEPSMNRHKPASKTTQVREWLTLLTTAIGCYFNSLAVKNLSNSVILYSFMCCFIQLQKLYNFILWNTKCYVEFHVLYKYNFQLSLNK